MPEFIIFIRMRRKGIICESHDGRAMAMAMPGQQSMQYYQVKREYEVDMKVKVKGSTWHHLIRSKALNGVRCCFSTLFMSFNFFLISCPCHFCQLHDWK